ncbi:Uncharacterised protein [Mycobacteroides abscessus subsp. abscessus]|nr:Uncharacterised protein [Mycobacteroides abscessus subsp. abscessus]
MWELSVPANCSWILDYTKIRFRVTTPLHWVRHKFCLFKWQRAMPLLPMGVTVFNRTSLTVLKMLMAR